MSTRDSVESRFISVGVSRLSLCDRPPRRWPTKDTSKAYEQSRTTLFEWERQLPTVEQVDADTASGANRAAGVRRAA